MEIDEALERVHAWLRKQGWWSDERDVIVSLEPGTRGNWIVEHTTRRYAESLDPSDKPVGRYGPVVLSAGGRISAMEPRSDLDWKLLNEPDVDLWDDEGTVMLRVVTPFGDPVELTEHEVRWLVHRLVELVNGD